MATVHTCVLLVKYAVDTSVLRVYILNMRKTIALDQRTLNVRVPAELYADLQELADLNKGIGETRASLVRRVLDQACQAEKEEEVMEYTEERKKKIRETDELIRGHITHTRQSLNQGDDSGVGCDLTRLLDLCTLRDRLDYRALPAARLPRDHRRLDQRARLLGSRHARQGRG